MKMSDSKCDRFDRALPLICGLLTSFVTIFAGLWTLVQGVMDDNLIWIGGIFLLIIGLIFLYMFVYLSIKYQRGQLGDLFEKK